MWMGIREKIAARKSQEGNGGGFNRALLRMAGIILTGYVIGTVIALMLLAWK